MAAYREIKNIHTSQDGKQPVYFSEKGNTVHVVRYMTNHKDTA